MNRPTRAALGLACAVFAVAGSIGCAGAASAAPGAPAGPPLPGHFAGKTELVMEMKGKGGQTPETRSGRMLWAVRQPMYYRTKAGDLITVPAGMTTDLASIPAIVSPLLHPDGPWARAAVVHDLCYASRGSMMWKGHPGRSRPAPYTRAECDDILDEAMAALGVPWPQRWAIWSGVRAGGSAAFGH